MHVRTYITYESKIDDDSRETERQRERERDDNKAQGIVPYLFLIIAVCTKQEHSLQSYVWVQIKNIIYNFDRVLKSFLGM